MVSKADGIVTRVETMDGEAAVKEGDTVTEGEILISGTVSMEPPCTATSGALLPDPRPGPGGGQDLAHPHRVHPAHRPGQGVHRRGKKPLYPDGPGISRGILSKRWHFLAWYDKISTVYQAGLPGGLTLPLSWTGWSGTGL